MIPIDWLPGLMFGILILFLLSGFPVAFGLAGTGLLFAAVAVEQGLIQWTLIQAIPERIFGIMSNDTLLAIPFFTLMGIVLEKSGMAEDLLDTVGQLFGRIRGGLGYAVVLVGALLAATTGVVAASVISMGLISLPIMLKYGYNKQIATGVIAASGTLAQIIPPSLVLIVLGDQLGVSIGAMYTGALIPGLLLTGLYLLFLIGVSVFYKNALPALPPEAIHLSDNNGRAGYTSLLILTALGTLLGVGVYHWGVSGGVTVESDLGAWLIQAITAGVASVYLLTVINKKFQLGVLSRLTESVVLVLVPPLGLIFLVLGTIFMGLATPTEGGAMGATGALLLAATRGRLGIDRLKNALQETAKLSSFVMFILIGSTVFGLTFRAIEGDTWIEHLMGTLPGGPVGFLIATNVLVFVLGCFLDFFEIAFILLPLLVPVAHKLGIDPIWFGVMLGLNMQTSFLTPPFGFSLFYLKSVAPRIVRTSDIYKGVVPFIAIQLLMVVLVYAFPELVWREKAIVLEDKPLELEIPDAGYGTPQ